MKARSGDCTNHPFQNARGLFYAVAFLDFAFQLLAPAIDLVEIVIGEFTPLFLDLALGLFPVSFNAIPVHWLVLRSGLVMDN